MTVTERMKQILISCGTPENHIEQIIDVVKTKPENQSMKDQWNMVFDSKNIILDNVLINELIKAAYEYIYVK